MINFKEFLFIESITNKNLTFGVEIEIPFRRKDFSSKNLFLDEKYKNSLIKKTSNLLSNASLDWDVDIDFTCFPGVEIKCKPLQINEGNLQRLSNDLNYIKNNIESIGETLWNRSADCGTHIHIGGLSQNQKIKFIQLWSKKGGNLESLAYSFLDTERKKQLDSGRSKFKSVDSIDQYRTLPHKIYNNKILSFVYNSIHYLGNLFVNIKESNSTDKYLSLAHRPTYGTLEFRLKESTLDGKELFIIIKIIASLFNAIDILYQQINDISAKRVIDTISSDVSLRDIAYVLKKNKN